MKNMHGIKMRAFAISLIVALLFAGTAAGEVSRAGLVGEWRFEGDVVDTSGSGNDGVINGATFVEGKFGKALSFDGVDDFVSVPDSASLDIIGSITIEAWIKPNLLAPATHQRVLVKNGVNGYMLNVYGDYSETYIGGTLAMISTISSGQWTHILATSNGSRIMTYLNGVKVYDAAYTGIINAGTYELRIGRESGVDFFNGIIDEVRIYNRALTAEEVKASYEAGQIIVTSTVSGAEVLLDGTPRGTASPSLTITGVSPGIHTVTCRLSGYSDNETTVNLAASSTTQVTCTLSRLPGSISVTSSPSGAEVYLDGTQKGLAPVMITNVPPGTRIIWCKKSGYEDAQQNIEVTSGGVATVNCTLSPTTTVTTPPPTVTPTPTATSTTIPTPTTFVLTTPPTTAVPTIPVITTSVSATPDVVSVNERITTATFASINADQYKIIEIQDGKGQIVSKISFGVNKDVSDVALNIETIRFRPDVVKTEVDGNVYSYLSINPKNIQSSDLYSTTIEFKIEKSWIDSNNIDPATVALYRFRDEHWDRLPTTRLKEDSDYIYYTADSPGFSIFAVSAISSRSELPIWVIMLGGLGIIALLGIIVIRKRKVDKPKPIPTGTPEPLNSASSGSIPKKSEIKGKIDVKSAYEYRGSKIFYKIKLENNTSETIGDVKVDLFVPDVFLLIEKEKSISMLEPNESKTVTFEIRPTGECGDCNVSGKIEYYDYSTKGREKLDMETKKVGVICPVLRIKEIDLRQWDQITNELRKAEENIKELSVPAENLFNITSRVIKDKGMFMLKPEITSTPSLFEAYAKFYAEGVTGLRYAAYIEVVGGARKSRLILKAWAEKEEALTGFYHALLDEIEKRIDIKIFIDDSIVQYNVTHVDIKESVIQRSNIGAGEKKCPNCGRKVEADEKLCTECGAKL